MTDPHTTTTHVLENSLAYSVPPALPPDDIIDSILDARGSRDDIRSILDEHGVIDNGPAYCSALVTVLRMFAETKTFARRPGRHRALAYCCLMLLGRCELSEPEVAKLCRVSKSDVSRWKRDLERRWRVEAPGIRRSREARARFSASATLTEQRKRESRAHALGQWQSIWKSL